MRHYGLVVFQGLFLASIALADWTRISPKEFELGAPPKEGSAAYKKDFKDLHDYQESREQAACDLAATQRFPSFKVFFNAKSKTLSAAEIKESRELLEKVVRFSVKVSSHFKKIYERPRPYSVDEDLDPCIDEPGGSKSYPSSHAAAAATAACILADRYPDKKERLIEYGNYLGELRAIVGVHHPSDVEAGQDLAAQICERLLSEPDFPASP